MNWRRGAEPDWIFKRERHVEREKNEQEKSLTVRLDAMFCILSRCVSWCQRLEERIWNQSAHLTNFSSDMGFNDIWIVAFLSLLACDDDTTNVSLFARPPHREGSLDDARLPSQKYPNALAVELRPRISLYLSTMRERRAETFQTLKSPAFRAAHKVVFMYD